MAEDEKPAPAGRSKTAEHSPEPRTVARPAKARPSQVPDLPDSLAGKYLRVGNTIYRAPEDRQPVIRLAPDRIKTRDLDALPDIVRIAKANGWTGIRIDGGDRFKRAAYLAAAAQGLTVENYNPSRKVAAEAERMRARLARRNARGDAAPSTEPDAKAPDGAEAARLLSARFLRQSDRENARDTDLWRAQSLVAQARAIAAAKHPGDPAKAAKETEAKRQQIANRIASGDAIAPVLHRDGRPVSVPQPARARERAGRSR